MPKKSKLKKFKVTMREPAPYFTMVVIAENAMEAREDAMKTGNTVVAVEEYNGE